MTSSIRPAHAIIAGVFLSMIGADLALAQVDELIVTVRKREESVRDIPVAVTVFNKDFIEDAGISDLDDVANLTPGFNFFSPLGEFLPTPVIRGVAPTSIFGENNTAIFVDGVYIASRRGLNFSQVDVERIEVVKGPQSALYGRNAFSGLINVITGRPTQEFEGQVEGTYGSDERYTAKAVVSGPIVQNVLAARAAVTFDEFEGTYDNANPLGPEDIGGNQSFIAQGSLLFTPTDAIEVLLGGYYSTDRIGPPPLSGVSTNCEPETGSFGETRLQNFCGSIPSIDDDQLFVPAGVIGENREVMRYHWTLDWDIGFGTASYNGGFNSVRANSVSDGGRGQPNLFRYATTASAFPFPGLVEDNFLAQLIQPDLGEKSKEWSHEVRWTSPDEYRVRGSLGAFYFSSNALARGSAVKAALGQSELPADFAFLTPGLCFFACFPTAGAAFTDIFSDDFGAFGDEQSFGIDKTNQWAVFGYVEADITSQLTARFELRYSKESKKFFAGTGTAIGSSGDGDWGIWTPRLSLDWDITDDAMVYFSAARGTKSGGFSTADIDPSTATLLFTKEFDPEFNWTYEVGAKTTWLDGRLFAEAAVYYIDWSNIVIPQIDTSFANLPTFSENAGTADVIGAEVALSAQITEHFSALVGASFTDAEIDEAFIASFAGFPTFAPDGDMSGQKLLRTPKWQANGSLAYQRPLFNSDFEWFARTDVSYQSKQFVGLPNQGIIPGRTIVNLRAGVTSDMWDFELWVDNVTNNDKAASAFRDVWFSNVAHNLLNDTTFFPFRLTAQHPELRTFGGTIRFKF